jgi:tripartite-type tricarboxylate transporter receptor subunit TctC
MRTTKSQREWEAMQRSLLVRLVGLSFGFAAAGIAPGAMAQQYPNQDIHFICGYPAGTGADTIVRYYAEKMRPISGRTIIVENKPGAGANIAIEYVSKSKPDGYTILVNGGYNLASNMHLYKKPPVASVNDFQIFASINRQAFMMTVDANKPWKTVADVTAAMKAKGAKATFGTGAPASIVMGAMYKAGAGIEAVEVNYRQSSDMMNDMLGGQIDYAMMEPVFSVGQQKQGRLRILAVSSAERLNAAPEIPTFLESGIAGLSMNLWWSGMVPAQTPKPIIEQLNKWFNEITATEETKKFLNGFASDPFISTPEQAQAMVNRDEKAWAEYMRIAKMEPQG